MYKTRSMEDEILKIMAAEIAGENVTKEEREKMNRWWEEKRGNERTYKMLMGELGEVVRLVRQQGGLDREKAYERLESDIRKKMTVRKGKIRRMRWWSFGASVAGVLLILGVGIMLWMKPEENGVWEGWSLFLKRRSRKLSIPFSQRLQIRPKRYKENTL